MCVGQRPRRGRCLVKHTWGDFDWKPKAGDQKPKLVGTLNDLRNLVTNISIVVSPYRECKMDSDEPNIDHKI